MGEVKTRNMTMKTFEDYQMMIEIARTIRVLEKVKAGGGKGNGKLLAGLKAKYEQLANK
jgi:hypothetical protein